MLLIAWAAIVMLTEQGCCPLFKLSKFQSRKFAANIRMGTWACVGRTFLESVPAAQIVVFCANTDHVADATCGTQW